MLLAEHLDPPGISPFINRQFRSPLTRMKKKTESPTRIPPLHQDVHHPLQRPHLPDPPLPPALVGRLDLHRGLHHCCRRRHDAAVQPARALLEQAAQGHVSGERPAVRRAVSQHLVVRGGHHRAADAHPAAAEAEYRLEEAGGVDCRVCAWFVVSASRFPRFPLFLTPILKPLMDRS